MTVRECAEQGGLCFQNQGRGRNKGKRIGNVAGFKVVWAVQNVSGLVIHARTNSFSASSEDRVSYRWDLVRVIQVIGGMVLKGTMGPQPLPLSLFHVLARTILLHHILSP
jgi:hypothetical protein